MASGKSATITSSVNGIFGLTKSGTGTLTLSPTTSNGFTGDVAISGTLAINKDTSLGNAANNVLIGPGITTGTLQTTLSLTTSRSISPGIFGGTISAGSGTTLTINGALGGSSNPLTVSGQGLVILNTASTRSGSTTIQNGTVRLNIGTGLGTGGITVASGILEIPAGGGTANFVTLQSNGTLRNGTTGQVAQKSGSVSVNANGSTVFLNSGDSASNVLLVGNGNNDEYIGGTGAKTVVSGIGIVTLNSPTNSYAGDWQIDSGTLAVSGGSALGTATTPVVVNNSGTLLLGGNNSRNVNLNSGSTLAFESVPQSNGVHTIASAANVTFALKSAASPTLGDAANDLTGGAGATITVTSDTAGGKIQLNNPNDYAGNWTIGNLATVRIADAGALGTATSPIVLSGTGTLQISAVTLNRAINLNNGATLAFDSGAQSVATHTVGTSSAVTFALRGAGNATLGDAGNDLTGGSGSTITVTSETAGNTLIVNQSSNYTGNWAIGSLATVRVGNPSALGTGAATVNSAGTLEINNLTLDRVVTMNSGATLIGTGASARANGTITVSGNAGVFLGTGGSPSDVFTLGDGANDLTGGAANSSILVVGAGKVVLTQDSDYVGAWFVSSGTLQVSNPTGSATGSGAVRVTNTGTLQGTGSIAGPVENFGIIAPGASPGKLTLTTTYTQKTGGSLQIELAGTAPGTGYDQLLVTGAASLAGTLDVSLVGGFKPATGDAFDVLVAGSRTGTFGTVQLPDLGGRVQWNTAYTSTTAAIFVTATFYAGDLNRDSLVNVADIAAMEGALTDLAAYQAMNGPGGGALMDPQLLLIANPDGNAPVTNADLQGLIILLANSGGGGSISAVPEPRTIQLALVSAAIVGLALRRYSRYGYY